MPGAANTTKRPHDRSCRGGGRRGRGRRGGCAAGTGTGKQGDSPRPGREAGEAGKGGRERKLAALWGKRGEREGQGGCDAGALGKKKGGEGA